MMASHSTCPEDIILTNLDAVVSLVSIEIRRSRGADEMNRTLVAEIEPRVEAGPPAACCTSVAAPDVSGEQAQTLADVFKALADPTRVRIVNMLVNADEAVCVCDF